MDFDVRTQLLARRIRNPQPAVIDLASGILEYQPRPVPEWFHLCAQHGQLHAQWPCVSGSLLNDEILPQPVHAHAVFLDQTGPDKTHQLVRDFQRTRFRKTCSLREGLSVERWG